MKAAIFKGKGTIEPGERPDPTIKEPTDAVVRVVLACVCGSDLLYYRGARHQREPTFLSFLMMF
jgi:alcohol dehydrogenase